MIDLHCELGVCECGMEHVVKEYGEKVEEAEGAGGCCRVGCVVWRGLRTSAASHEYVDRYQELVESFGTVRKRVRFLLSMSALSRSYISIRPRTQAPRRQQIQISTMRN
jgi:hypothetical protein